MNMEQAGDVVEQVLIPHGLNRVIIHDRRPKSRATSGGGKAGLRGRRGHGDARAVRTASLRGFSANAAGAIYLDLLRDMKSINSHIVAGAAYPILERAGELLESRISTNAGSE